MHLCFLSMQGQFVINSSDEIYDAMWAMIVMEIFFSSTCQRPAWVTNDAKNWKIRLIYSDIKLLKKKRILINLLLYWFAVISIALKRFYIVLLSTGKILDYLVLNSILFSSFSRNDIKIQLPYSVLSALLVLYFSECLQNIILKKLWNL